MHPSTYAPSPLNAFFYPAPDCPYKYATSPSTATITPPAGTTNPKLAPALLVDAGCTVPVAADADPADPPAAVVVTADPPPGALPQALL
jgi:hypothetical protein